MSVVGTNVQFHCAGTGHPDILARGIATVTISSSGTVQSNLTVPATSVNNILYNVLSVCHYKWAINTQMGYQYTNGYPFNNY